MAKYEKDETFVVGQTTTGSILLNEGALTGFIVTGSVLTGTQITFTASLDGINFYSLYDADSTEVGLTYAGSPRAYSLNPSVFMAWNSVKARLGTSASAVAQATYNQPVAFIVDGMI